jgi:hypothetical protein
MKPHLLHDFHEGKSANFVGTFSEESPIRKLFKNTGDFEFVIQQVTNQGPIHERVGIGLLLKECESILTTIGSEIEIKPIEGITIRSFSPRFAEMTLPLNYPAETLSLAKSPTEVEEFIGEGPIERVLANALIAQTLHYFNIFLSNQEKKQSCEN